MYEIQLSYNFDFGLRRKHEGNASSADARFFSAIQMKSNLLIMVFIKFEQSGLPVTCNALSKHMEV